MPTSHKQSHILDPLAELSASPPKEESPPVREIIKNREADDVHERDSQSPVVVELPSTEPPGAEQP